MSGKIKIELDENILKKLKPEDLMVILGVQQLSESKTSLTEISLADIGKQAYEELINKSNTKSNPIVNLIKTQNEPETKETKEQTAPVLTPQAPQTTTDQSKNSISSNTKSAPEPTTISTEAAKSNNLSSKSKQESTQIPVEIPNITQPKKSALQINFYVLSINHEISVEDKIHLQKN